MEIYERNVLYNKVLLNSPNITNLKIMLMTPNGQGNEGGNGGGLVTHP